MHSDPQNISSGLSRTVRHTAEEEEERRDRQVSGCDSDSEGSLADRHLDWVLVTSCLDIEEDVRAGFETVLGDLEWKVKDLGRGRGKEG